MNFPTPQHVSEPSQHYSEPGQYYSEPTQYYSESDQYYSEPGQYCLEPDQYYSESDEQLSSPPATAGLTDPPYIFPQHDSGELPPGSFTTPARYNYDHDATRLSTHFQALEQIEEVTEFGSGVKPVIMEKGFNSDMHRDFRRMRKWVKRTFSGYSDRVHGDGPAAAPPVQAHHYQYQYQAPGPAPQLQMSFPAPGPHPHPHPHASAHYPHSYTRYHGNYSSCP
ncbi:hypothetical protein FRB95_013794 [Tulasnella sp. JGI-2019a]|nr:hypothetical protein FRB95_013794 [Tulasnella sp. JGI-2019a]